jgi:hypothetical protein
MALTPKRKDRHAPFEWRRQNGHKRFSAVEDEVLFLTVKIVIRLIF